MSRTITDWSISSDPFRAPEHRGLYLNGTCDGRSITTSRVVEIVEPRLYKTKSGSLYRLEGNPNPDYAKWCQGHGIVLDAENPITLKKEVKRA